MKKLDFLIFILVCIRLDCTRGAVFSSVIKDYRAFVREGDLNLGFMTGIHRPPTCDGRVQLSDALGPEQVAMALDLINEQSDLLPNITLGLVALDTCKNSLRALARSVYFLPDDDNTLQATPLNYPHGVNMTLNFDLNRPHHYLVVGVMGVTYSAYAVNIAALLSAYKIPLISQSATSDELSDKTRFPYFLRLVPPDRFSGEALVSIAEKFNWNYVSLLYSEGSYGEYSAKELEKLIKASATGMCIAYSKRMSPDTTPEEYLSIGKELKKYRKSRVVFLVSEGKQQRGLFRALEKLGLSQTFIFLLGDIFSKYQTVAEGSIHVGHNSFPIPGYDEYIQNITPWTEPGNPWLQEAWQLRFRCLWNVTDVNSNQSCYHFSMHDWKEQLFSRSRRGNSRLYDTVFVYAHALHSLIRDNCPQHFQQVDKASLRDCVTGPKLLEHLKKVDIDGLTGRIKFDDKGDVMGEYLLKHYKRMEDGSYRDNTVGWWSKLTETLHLNMSLIDWSALKNNEVFPTKFGEDQYIPESVCSKPCGPRQFFIIQELQCCWECYDCRENERLVGNHSGCEECPPFHWPTEDDHHNCIPIEPYYLSFSDTITIGLVVLAIASLFITMATACALYKFRDHRLIRATSRELCIVILIGTLTASCTVVCFLLKPTDVTCRIRLLGFHFAINLIYSPLMVKTIRIYRIFSSGKRSVKRPRFVSTFAQMVLTLCVVMLQIFILMGVHIVSPVSAGLQQRVRTIKHVELKCDQDLHSLLMPLAYNMLLILICAVVGYMTRKLPDNFNESWYIFVLVSTTLFAWLVFLPAYFSTFHAYQQMALLAFCLVLNAYITNGVLFGPKLYAVVYVNENKLQFGLSQSATSQIQAMPSTSTCDDQQQRSNETSVYSRQKSSDV